jgi:hypothetical protein
VAGRRRAGGGSPADRDGVRRETSPRPGAQRRERLSGRPRDAGPAREPVPVVEPRLEPRLEPRPGVGLVPDGPGPVGLGRAGRRDGRLGRHRSGGRRGSRQGGGRARTSQRGSQGRRGHGIVRVVTGPQQHQGQRRRGGPGGQQLPEHGGERPDVGRVVAPGQRAGPAHHQLGPTRRIDHHVVDRPGTGRDTGFVQGGERLGQRHPEGDRLTGRQRRHVAQQRAHRGPPHGELVVEHEPSGRRCDRDERGQMGVAHQQHPVQRPVPGVGLQRVLGRARHAGDPHPPGRHRPRRTLVRRPGGSPTAAPTGTPTDTAVGTAVGAPRPIPPPVHDRLPRGPGTPPRADPPCPCRSDAPQTSSRRAGPCARIGP